MASDIREGDRVELLDEGFEGIVLEVDRHQAKVDIEWDARWYPISRMVRIDQ